MRKYEMNETMKLLGYQFVLNDENKKQVQDVLDAYKQNFDLISFAVDVFNLGMINGIRKERSKNK